MQVYFLFQFIITAVFSVILSIQDIKSRKISNWILILFAVCALTVSVIFNFKSWYLFLISAVLSGIFYLLIYFVSRKKLGFGDIYFGITQGFVLLPQYLWICIVTETACALIFAALNRKNLDKQIKLPFIPFMSAGLIAAFSVRFIVFLSV